MRRVCLLVVVLFLLSGCSKSDGDVSEGMALRQKLLQGNGCSFDTTITADYGDVAYQFEMHCQADTAGSVNFTVKSPDSISGITGTLSAGRGNLTFDDQVLAFAMLADGQITPVSSPWIMLQTLRSGYLTSCGQSGDGLVMALDDSYREDALHLEVYTDGEGLPTGCEILWKGRRIVTLQVENFTFL